MPAPSYPEAVDKLMSLADFERKSRANEPPDFHLRRMGILLDELGEPHLAVPTVHVAGSKGKGSTAALIAAALEAHGLRVGLYTSPHLHYVRERIRVGHEPISEGRFADLVEALWPHVAAINERGDFGQVSVFELLTAMAFQEFRSRRLDVQVIEVGLGGRLDATNLVRPEVCVITPVGLDHTAVLGDTIPQIACEKAGIIKEGVPVVTGKQPAEATEVIGKVARERNAPLTRALDRVLELSGTEGGRSSLAGAANQTPGHIRPPSDAKRSRASLGGSEEAMPGHIRPPFDAEKSRAGLGGSEEARPGRIRPLPVEGSEPRLGAQPVALRGSLGDYRTELPLLGLHQVDNARVAVAALEVLADRGWAISPARVSRGLSRVEWPARMQVLTDRAPRIVVDGAHNADAASALARSVQFHLPSVARVLLIFGGTGGHDYARTAREFGRLNPVFIVTRSRHPKSQDPAVVAQRLIGDNMAVAAVTENTAEALEAARRLGDSGDLILATGSLFIAAEVIEHVKGIRPEHYPSLGAASRATPIQSR